MKDLKIQNYLNLELSPLFMYKLLYDDWNINKMHHQDFRMVGENGEEMFKILIIKHWYEFTLTLKWWGNVQDIGHKTLIWIHPDPDKDVNR